MLRMKNKQWLLSKEEARQLDESAWRDTEPDGYRYMEHAAAAMMTLTCQRFPALKGPVLVLAGRGSNGGDGILYASLLAQRSYSVILWLWGQPETSEAKKAFSALKEGPLVKVRYGNEGNLTELARDLASASLCLDALLGTGTSRPVEGLLLSVIRLINQAGKEYRIPVMAADLPSGLFASTGQVLSDAVKADLTITFGAAKRGLFLYPGRLYAGEVVVCDIGLPRVEDTDLRPYWTWAEALTLQRGPEFFDLVQRDPAGHKGTFGKTMILGAGYGMAGAGAFAALAAMYSGSGLVCLYSHPDNRIILQSRVPEAVWHSCEDLADSGEMYDTAVIGPGLGRESGKEVLVFEAMKRARKAIILDADALYWLSRSKDLITAVQSSLVPCILTPHLGEAQRLLSAIDRADITDQAEMAKVLAEYFHCFAAVKSSAVMVAGPKDLSDPEYDRLRCHMSIAGSHALATGGSGDILAGMIGGYLAGMTLKDQRQVFGGLVSMVNIHGLSGRQAALAVGARSVTARHILEALPSVIRKWDETNV